MLTFNEFQRELQKKGVEPKSAYFFTMLYEQFAELMKQHQAIAHGMVEMAGGMQMLQQLSEKDTLELRSIKKMLSEGTGLVGSVAPDPDTEH